MWEFQRHNNVISNPSSKTQVLLCACSSPALCSQRWSRSCQTAQTSWYFGVCFLFCCCCYCFCFFVHVASFCPCSSVCLSTFCWNCITFHSATLCADSLIWEPASSHFRGHWCSEFHHLQICSFSSMSLGNNSRNRITGSNGMKVSLFFSFMAMLPAKGRVENYKVI